MTQDDRRWAKIAVAAALILAGCEGAVTEDRFDEIAKEESIFGSDNPSDLGGFLFGDEDAPAAQGGGGVAVNAFLWRAALDTVGFLPLSSADPFGGVIITDWYSSAQNGQERFKVNVVILSRELVADGVNARVFREVRDGATGGWVSASVDQNTPGKLENAILQRARELRIAAAQ